MESQMSKQYQTTIPSNIRKRLNIKPGSQLNWRVSKNRLGVEYAIVIPETKENILTLKGVGKDMYKKVGGAKKYIKGEKESWN